MDEIYNYILNQPIYDYYEKDNRFNEYNTECAIFNVSLFKSIRVEVSDHNTVSIFLVSFGRSVEIDVRNNVRLPISRKISDYKNARNKRMFKDRDIKEEKLRNKFINKFLKKIS